MTETPHRRSSKNFSAINLIGRALVGMIAGAAIAIIPGMFFGELLVVGALGGAVIGALSATKITRVFIYIMIIVFVVFSCLICLPITPRSQVAWCTLSADCEGIDLSEANLKRASFVYLNSGLMNLNRANLREADLRWAQFGKVYLCEADLRGADLSHAFLSDVHLFDADLSNADLSNAQLYGVFLSGANLEGANLQGTRLEGAYYDHNTKWPEGVDPSTTGAALNEFWYCGP